GREAIIVTELPYQVNKARLVEEIAYLVRDKKVTGISDLRDESDRNGMRIVIELKKGEVPEVVINNLYKHTQLQTTFGVIMLALVDGRPRYLSLPKMIDRKSTRLNSSHVKTSYAVFCLTKQTANTP